MRKITVLPWVIGAGVVLVILVVLAVSLRDWLEADAVAAADEAAEANLSALGTAYVSDEFGYSAAFPGDPKVETKATTTTDVSFDSTYATWEDAGTTYEIIGTEMPGGLPNGVADPVLGTWFDAMAASFVGSTVTEQRFSYIDGHRAIVGLLSDPAATEPRYIGITVDGDVSYSIEIEGADKAERALFVGSLRFAGDNES